jgi:hypothetical protein
LIGRRRYVVIASLDALANAPWSGEIGHE